MTKEETLQLKGIAILMMLFLHLFNTDSQCRTMPDLYLFLEWEAACISIEPGGSLLCSNIHISQRIRTCHHL